MKLEKTREALVMLTITVPPGTTVHLHAAESLREVQDAESLLREAAALKSFAVAGLSAFHGRLCSGGGAHGLNMPTNPADCQDPKCRAWAAAVKGANGLEVVRNAALEEAESALAACALRCDSDDRLRTFADAAETVAALKRGG